MRKSVKKDRQAYSDNLEEAAGKNNLRTLYDISKKLANKPCETKKSIKNKDGKVVTSKKKADEEMGGIFQRNSKQTSTSRNRRDISGREYFQH